MPPEARPRCLAHRGHVLVHGVLHSDRRGEGSVRRDVVASFQRGVRVYRTPSGLVSVWLAPRRLAMPLPSGAPLVRYRSLLTCVPLTPAELECCPADRQALAVASAGTIACTELGPELEVDPSEWLTVDDFELSEITDLRAPPTPPALAIAPVAASGREALDAAVGEAPAELARVVAAVARRVAAGTSGGRLAPRLVELGLTLARTLSRVFDVFRAARSGTKDTTGTTDSTGTELARAPSAATGRSWFQSLTEWLKRRIWRGQLGRWLGQQHARYLRELFSMFERGDFDAALRHAIPASKSSGGDASLALMPPSARASLELGARRGGGRRVGLGDLLHEHLRDVYRRAFRELERRGEILKAAFVLSELLQEDAEAVSFLERHGKLLEAAKLAEARELAPGLVVRQWFVAGNRERALMIARRDGAFRDAVDRLKSEPKLERALRLAWADHLAESGNFVGAVAAVAQLGEADALRLVWLQRAVQVGGVSGARALATWARQRPESFAEAAPLARQLVDDTSWAEARARLAFATGLADGPGGDTAERRAWLRGVTRAVIRDRARGLNQLDRTTLERWSRSSGDGALHADLPSLPSLRELSQRKAEQRQVVVAARDVGIQRLHDAVLLDDGRWLLAQGEAGVVLLGRKLERLHHFDVPASALVVSKHGDRALAVARRDSVTRVALIDVARRRCQYWSDLELGAYATSFDGATWYVGIGSRVHALDMLADEPRSLWQSADAEARILGVAADSAQLCFATAAHECWIHDVAPHRLRQRKPLRGVPLLTPAGAAADLALAHSRYEIRYSLTTDRDGVDGQFRFPVSEKVCVGHALASRSWLLVSFQLAPSTVELSVLTREACEHALTLVLEGAADYQARLDDERLVVCDDRGRVLAFDLDRGASIVDARI